MSQSVVLRGFGSGELAPAFAIRADLPQYQTGLRTCRNFLIRREGGIANRPGTRFVDELLVNSSNSRLFCYTSEVAGESVLIEVGDSYMRFFQNGALVEVDAGDVDAWDSGTAYEIGDIVSQGGVVYSCILGHTNHVPPNATYWIAFAGGVVQLATPWSDVSGLKMHQSGRTLTFTAPGVAPWELIFVSVVQWVLRAVNTAPQVGVPQNPLLSGTSAGARTYAYKITAAAPDTYEEGEPSAQVVGASVAAPTPDAPHVLNWDALTVDGVACPEYYVYCDPYANGSYGLLGTATSNSFRNPGITPDFTLTPPIPRVLFTSDYPTCSATFEQRRFFGNTPNYPDGFWGSRVGFPSNFGIASPLQDDDAITGRIAGNNHHPIRHFAALKAGLVTLTDGGIWIVSGPEGLSIAPNQIRADQHTYVGVCDVRPIVAGNGIIYVQARGSIPREVRFDVQVEGLAGRDLSLLAAHLVDGYTIADQDYALTPHSIVWFVRSDGTLLGLTYIQELNTFGWHRHDTQGTYEKVCVVPEPGEDAVYLIVRRVVDGTVKRFIERLESRTILDFDADSFFLDAGLSYDGAPVSNIAGLSHLEGATVGVVGDGEYLGTFEVIAGAVTGLPGSFSVIHAGLLIEHAEFETLDLDVAGSAIRDKKKLVKAITLVLEASVRSGLQAGPDSDTLVDWRMHPSEGDDPYTGLAELPMLNSYTQAGRTLVRQTVPLPLTVLGVIPSVEIGG